MVMEISNGTTISMVYRHSKQQFGLGMPTTAPHHLTGVFGKAYHNHCPISDLPLNFPWAVATKYDFGLTHGPTLNLLSIRFPAFFECLPSDKGPYLLSSLIRLIGIFSFAVTLLI